MISLNLFGSFLARGLNPIDPIFKPFDCNFNTFFQIQKLGLIPCTHYIFLMLKMVWVQCLRTNLNKAQYKYKV
jgi:hypothetical protein